MHSKEWFEMEDLKRRKLNDAVWIPLRQSAKDTNGLNYDQSGYSEEFSGLGSLAVFSDQKDKAKRLNWTDVGIGHSQNSWMNEGKYVPSDIYGSDPKQPLGIHLALEARGNSLEPAEWHLHQDLAIAFNLRREGDEWLAIEEGYEVVARLHREQEGKPRRLEIKSSYLKDYLCARGMELVTSSYYSRHELSQVKPTFSWSDEERKQITEDSEWSAGIYEIDRETGLPYGGEIAVFRTGRTDVDPTVDVPVFGMPTDDFYQESRIEKADGEKVYEVRSQLWKTEWITAGTSSPRIRGDKMPPSAFFTTDASGKQESRETLTEDSRWLWFRPELISQLAHRRGGQLSWYTRDTGSVACSPGCDVHFGMNSLGMVNIYAKDVAELPDWQQKIFSGFNISPEGRVSEELLDSQMRADPADTQPPEEFFIRGLKLLAYLSQKEFGTSILHNLAEFDAIAERIHRFRATDRPGLLALAKDIARLTADLLDVKQIRKLVPEAKSDLGSLKLLETLLTTKVGAKEARRIMGPLFGVYELRLGDAHLSSGNTTSAFRLLGIGEDMPPVLQGYRMLYNVTVSLHLIGRSLFPEEIKDSD